MIDPNTLTDLRTRGDWRELEARLRPYVARRVPNAADVDDVLQTVLMHILRGLDKLRDDRRFGPWVYQVTRNAIIDHHRAASARRALDDGDDLSETLAAPPDRQRDNEDVVREVAGYAKVFIDLMPSPYREALTLVELEGLTQQAAADRLGLSLSGMKSRVQRGRRKLRAALEACCHIALDARHRVIGCQPRPSDPAPDDGCCE